MGFGLLKAVCIPMQKAFGETFLRIRWENSLWKKMFRGFLVENKQKRGGIVLADREIEADIIISNADFPYTMQVLIQDSWAKGNILRLKLNPWITRAHV